MGQRSFSVEQRFWNKVDKESSSCWLWRSALSHGYGAFRVGGRSGRTMGAHRWSYEALVGPIPDGLTLDHLCRVRNCVNPEHLEPVTNAENIRRGMGRINGPAVNRAKTHCPKGHPYDDLNTYRYGNRRHCKECKRENTRRWRGAS